MGYKEETKMTKDEALNLALQELEALWSFYGEGLEVANWHRNGDLEPLDHFFDDNNFGALEALRSIKEIESNE